MTLKKIFKYNPKGKHTKSASRNQGCFRVKLDKGEITCSPKVSQDEISKEQEELFLSIEDTMSIINSSKLINKSSKNYYIEKLLDIANTGLSIDTAEVYPQLAAKALVKLKEEILLRESSSIKNRYMKKLGINVLVQTVILFVLIILITCFYPDKTKINNIISYIYVYIGAIVGAWISFGARKPNLSFEELSIIESDGLAPEIRLIYIGLCSMIILLFLKTEILVISINQISTKSITKSVEMQLALGITIGLIEYKISGKLFKKANFIMDRYD